MSQICYATRWRRNTGRVAIRSLSGTQPSDPVRDLTRPAPELTTEERAEVKKVARDLLKRLKELLVLNWRQKVTVRSQVRLAIEDALDAGLPRAYSPEIYKAKCSAVFEHMYEKYPEHDAGPYAPPS
jgi:type I restriction enzyme, R subunit